MDLSNLSPTALRAAATVIEEEVRNWLPAPDGNSCPSCDADKEPVARDLEGLAQQLRAAANR